MITWEEDEFDGDGWIQINEGTVFMIFDRILGYYSTLGVYVGDQSPTNADESFPLWWTLA